VHESVSHVSSMYDRGTDLQLFCQSIGFISLALQLTWGLWGRMYLNHQCFRNSSLYYSSHI